MKHEHIKPNDDRWNRRRYICVCGFDTEDRVAFDKHLEEAKNDEERE